MAGKVFGDTAKGLGNLAADVARKAVNEPGKIFEAATGGGSESTDSVTKPVAEPRAGVAVSQQLPQSAPSVGRVKEQEEINRLSQQIKDQARPPTAPVKRDVEAEITKVRQEKQFQERQIDEEEFLKKLQEEREKERIEAQKDAEEVIPKSKLSRGSARSPKAAGTKEMGKKRTG